MKLSQMMLNMMSVFFIVTGFYCFEEKLLFSTSSGKIKELNIIKGEVKVLGNAESEVFVLAYDNEDKYVYVPRQTQGQIIRFPYPSNQTTEFEIVVSEIIPGGIAFDSEHRYLYWTEPMEGKIMRCNTDGSNITRIFNDTVEPAALTIDKEHRWMYFGQGIPNGTIHKLSLDGEGHHIINDLASWVFGIYADDTRLYWMDNFMGDLKSALFDGTDIEMIVSTNTFKLNGEIDVKDEFIFYTSSTQIFKKIKNGGEVPIVLHTDTERVHGLLLFKQQEAYINYWVKDMNEIRTITTGNGVACAVSFFARKIYGPKTRTPYDKSSFKVNRHFHLKEACVTALTMHSTYTIHTMHTKWVHCFAKLQGNVSVLVSVQKVQDHRYFTSLMKVKKLERVPIVILTCYTTILNISHMRKQQLNFIWTTVQCRARITL